MYFFVSKSAGKRAGASAGAGEARQPAAGRAEVRGLQEPRAGAGQGLQILPGGEAQGARLSKGGKLVAIQECILKIGRGAGEGFGFLIKNLFG